MLLLQLLRHVLLGVRSRLGIDDDGDVRRLAGRVGEGIAMSTVISTFSGGCDSGVWVTGVVSVVSASGWD